MWALGCVLYTLLCGFPREYRFFQIDRIVLTTFIVVAFYDESISVLTEKVARGYYTFLSPWWDDISHSGELL